MNRILGWVCILGGVALGIYIGVWFLLVGGIMQIINNLNPINALEIAIGVVRIVFCGIGWVPASLGIITGTVILEEV